MSLWTRFTARRKARKAERKANAARKQQDRIEAQASLRRALKLGGREVGAMHVHHGLISCETYHVPSGTDCNASVSGNCSGMGI